MKSKSNANTTAQHLKKQQFRYTWLHALHFAASANKSTKCLRSAQNISPESFQIGARGFPQAMQTRCMNISNKSARESDLEANIVENRVPKRRWLVFQTG